MNNSHRILRTIKKEEKLARVQIADTVSNIYHQIDFFSVVTEGARDFEVVMQLDGNKVIPLKEIDKDMETSIAVSFNSEYTDKIFVECCARIPQVDICHQEVITLTHAKHWKISGGAKNRKINYKKELK